MTEARPARVVQAVLRAILHSHYALVLVPDAQIAEAFGAGKNIYNFYLALWFTARDLGQN